MASAVQCFVARKKNQPRARARVGRGTLVGQIGHGRVQEPARAVPSFGALEKVSLARTFSVRKPEAGYRPPELGITLTIL